MLKYSLLRSRGGTAPMARIYKDGKGEFWLDYKHPVTQIRRREPTHTTDEATAYLYLGQAMQGNNQVFDNPNTKENVLFSELVSKVREYKLKMKEKFNVKKNFDSHMIRALQKLGHLSLSQITRGVLKEFRAELAKETSNASADRMMTTLRNCFTIAISEWEWPIKHPYTEIETLKTKHREPELSGPAWQKLLDACPNPLKELVLFAKVQIMDKSSLLNLKKANFDIKDWLLTYIRPKTGMKVIIPIFKEVREIVVKRLFGLSENEFFFKDFYTPNGKPKELGREWAKARIKAGLADLILVNGHSVKNKQKLPAVERFHIDFHDLRHIGASACRDAGVKFDIVSQWMGHKSLKTTQIYVHYKNEQFQECAKLVDNSKQKISSEMAQTSLIFSHG